jgi:hypothetical protein
MFNSNIRGIGDRLKTMERIVYFLIGKAEGQQRVKVVSEHYNLTAVIVWSDFSSIASSNVSQQKASRYGRFSERRSEISRRTADYSPEAVSAHKAASEQFKAYCEG